jgi:uncharacterized protein involved in exopolysaccharide biosynthesis
VTVSTHPPVGRRETSVEERIEVRRYLDALWRSRWLIAGIVLLMTLVVVAVSVALPSKYTGTARLVLEQASSPLGEADDASTQRRLATTETLLTSQEVLDRAAQEVPGINDGDELTAKVSSSVEQDANIINIWRPRSPGSRARPTPTSRSARSATASASLP